jgi:hypothetical protein
MKIALGIAVLTLAVVVGHAQTSQPQQINLAERLAGGFARNFRKSSRIPSMRRSSRPAGCLSGLS